MVILLAAGSLALSVYLDYCYFVEAPEQFSIHELGVLMLPVLAIGSGFASLVLSLLFEAGLICDGGLLSLLGSYCLWTVRPSALER